jgi:DNA mismatch endonuclease (patch repair protein)
MMSAIRGKNTRPEMIIRQGLHARGLRYRLHIRNLPGTPDLVFPAARAVLFVHGCFWHGHNCHLFRMPSTRPDFWGAKIARNRATDERSAHAIKELGWRMGVVWECALKGRTRLPADDVLEGCETWLRSALPTLQIEGCRPVMATEVRGLGRGDRLAGSRNRPPSATNDRR